MTAPTLEIFDVSERRAIAAGAGPEWGGVHRGVKRPLCSHRAGHWIDVVVARRAWSERDDAGCAQRVIHARVMSIANLQREPAPEVQLRHDRFDLVRISIAVIRPDTGINGGEIEWTTAREFSHLGKRDQIA